MCVLLAGCGDDSVAGAEPDLFSPPQDAAAKDAAESADPGPDAQTPDVADVADSSPPDEGPPPDPGPDAPPPLEDVVVVPVCDPPLELDAASHIMPTLGFVILSPAGGTGGYRFELVQDGSGALLNELTGAYVSGAVGETVDVVRLTDVGCEGETELLLNVVSDPIVKPGDVTLPPGACIQFDVEFGSGDFAFEVLSTNADGTVTPEGLYQSGPAPGSDLLRVTDVATGRTGDLTVGVDESYALQTTMDRAFVALGSTLALPVIHGSSYVDVAADGVAGFAEGVITGDEIGQTVITVTDQYVGCLGPGGDEFATVDLPVAVVDALEAPTGLWGEGGVGAAVALGDKDGDGYVDAAFSTVSSHVGGQRAGAVFVYRGAEAGLLAEPAQIITGVSRDSDFGRRLLFADLDGDDVGDLVVAAAYDDVKGGNRGAVFAYRGVADGLFEEAPFISHYGVKNSDYFGTAIAVCDFNGDGQADLAVGAERAEDEAATPVSGDQGGVFIFLGGSDADIEGEADVALWGRTPDDEAGWVGVAGMKFGSTLGAGDFDGDGRCDLAVGAREFKPLGAGKLGSVYLFAGDAEAGLLPEPKRMWAETTEGAPALGFGGRIRLGDLDADGKDDLVTVERLLKVESKNKAGAIHVYVGADFSDAAATEYELPGSADWSAFGLAASNELGGELNMADIDGDGALDLLAASNFGEVPGVTPNNVGGIRAWAGVPGALPAAESFRLWAGLKGSDRFARGFAAIGDLNGDGESELLSYASHADELGVNVGRAYTVWGRPTPAVEWGDEWVYDDTGVDHQDAWLAGDFDDSGWTTGQAPFAYDADDAPGVLKGDPGTPSFYFRKTIDLAQPVAWAELKTSHNDGIAVWINGALVLVDGMTEDLAFAAWSDGGSTKSTKASRLFGPDDEEPLPFVVGENTVAVMVKSWGVDDDYFDFDLTLQTHASLVNFDGDVLPLEHPVKRSLSRVTESMAVVDDVTGDGLADLLVGARDALPEGPTRGGLVYLHAGTTDGFEAAPVMEFSGFPLYAGGNQFGRAVASAGDFDGDGIPELALASRIIDRPKSYPEGFAAPAECQVAKKDPGAVFLFRAPAAGPLPESTPSVVMYGMQTSQYIDAIAAGFDSDGDGLDDVAMGAYIWDSPGASNAGGFQLVRGRAADPSGAATVICEPDAFFTGRKKDDYLARAMAALGDLNGDGCDELAVGSELEDFETGNNQGSVRIFFGWGAKCQYKSARVLLLATGKANDRAGAALAGGHDLDGDGVGDLVVGAPDYRLGSLRPGAVYWISGAHIRLLEPMAVTVADGQLPADQVAQPYSELDVDPLLVVGDTDETANFGRSVSFVPGGASGGVLVAVGAYGSDFGGVGKSGGVQIFEPFQTRPVATFGGETHRTNGLLGLSVTAGALGGKPVVVVGGVRASPVNVTDRIDDGAAYTLLLD